MNQHDDVPSVIMESLKELIPDFEPLLSPDLSSTYEDLDPLAKRVLSPVLPTLRALSQDPRILSRALLSYLNLTRDSELHGERGKIKAQCKYLATKYADLITAAQALHTLRAHQLVQSGKGSIHAMPVEVLSLIFAASTVPRVRHDYSDPFDMKLRLVCRSWRDVIDNTPQLWAHLDIRMKGFDFDRFASILLRSGGYPLEIWIHLEAFMIHDDLLPLLQPAISRARYLGISCAPWGLRSPTTQANWETKYDHAMEGMRQLFKAPAPLLEVLQVTDMEFEDEVFSGVTPPKLHSVHLLDCSPVPPTACFFSSPLTSLSADNCRCWESIDDMLAVLTRLPNLRRFQWDTDDYLTIPTFHNPAAYPSKSLPLPRLENIELNLELELVVLIIPILDFPTSATITIAGSFAHIPVADAMHFRALLDDLRSTFEPLLRAAFPSNTCGFKKLSIQDHTRGENEEGFSIVMKDPNYGGHDNDPPTTFDFGACHDMTHQDEYMLILEQALSWPGIGRTVTEMEFNAHGNFMRNELQWERLLWTLPALHTMDVCGPAAAHLLCALRTPASWATSGFASNLRTVILNSVGPRVIAALCQTLDWRDGRSFPRLVLKLYQCKIDFGTLVQLRLHRGIKSVEWDGELDGRLVYGDYDESDEENSDEASE